MDAFLSFLIDVVCFYTGKLVWLLFRKIGVVVEEWSYGTFVVAGLLAIAASVIGLFFVMGSIYV
ncbi:MAG: hypothetical protein U0989_18475 [Azonexus sp.]|nr:hypothetical protein [Azonexus sp.]